MTLRTILFTSTAILAGTFTPAYADAPAPQPSISGSADMREVGINDADAGSLMFKTGKAGKYIEAPMVATDVDMDIAGPVIRTKVSQSFQNTSDAWVEGVYVFPLPENAAVDRLRMVIGGRMIEGQIKEKKQAKKIYEQAKAQGKKASLVEQQRPNMFTASVANIGPHETVAIQIEYQDKAVMKDGVFTARFPMTVAPRYSPPAQTVQVATTDGLQNLVLDPVLDRKAISPPLQNPKLEPIKYMRLPVTMDITLDAGFNLAEVKSAYHNIAMDVIDEDSAAIRLAEGAVPANRDFMLEWRAQETAEPYSALFKQTVGDDTYLLSMLTPPGADASDVKVQARESIFVIDTSGSMGGTSIEQARASLLLALDNLKPEDTFNMIRFSNTHHSFNPASVPATQSNIKSAKRWVGRLNAGGGTQMSPALADALRARGSDKSRLRQVIFITDGAIGNERQLFAQIKDELKDARLFPVGIGSAPNSYFMSRAAKFGRGTFVQIGDTSEVTKRMGALFKAIDSPVLTDIKTNISGSAFPARNRDVYQGDPVISIAKVKTKDLPKSFSVAGNMAGENWKRRMALSEAQAAGGLSVLWARAKIADLEESRFDRAGADKIDGEILQTALDHHIVSRLTSLVAVDITPSRPAGDALETAKVPTMLPEGWDFAKLTGVPDLAPAGQNRAAPAPMPASAPQNMRLPNTASPHQVLGLLGALLSLLGIGMARLPRRRRA